jgi:hypothetical protein
VKLEKSKDVRLLFELITEAVRVDAIEERPVMVVIDVLYKSSVFRIVLVIFKEVIGASTYKADNLVDPLTSSDVIPAIRVSPSKFLLWVYDVRLDEDTDKLCIARHF